MFYCLNELNDYENVGLPVIHRTFYQVLVFLGWYGVEVSKT